MEKQKGLEIERKSMYVFLNMNNLDVFSRRCVFLFFVLMNYRPKCKLNLPFFLTPMTPILVLSPSLRYKGKAKKSNLVPNASFRYKRKAKKIVKIALGTRLFNTQCSRNGQIHLKNVAMNAAKFCHVFDHFTVTKRHRDNHSK